MAASIIRKGAAEAPATIYFYAGNELGFATRYGNAYMGKNHWRGFRLCGVGCKRVKPQLVAGNVRVPVTVLPTMPPLPPEADGPIV